MSARSGTSVSPRSDARRRRRTPADVESVVFRNRRCGKLRLRSVFRRTDTGGMSRSLARVTATVLLAVGAAFAAQATPAFASLSSLLAPPAPPVKVIPPVQAPVSADPVAPPVGTMLIVHGGGWTGHDGDVQRHLLTARGDLFLARGWRVVSVDYNEGPLGIQDVMDAAGAELARGTSNGPLCIYGESSGGHIALMVAARMRSIDCVIGVGTPTDLKLYADEEAGNPNPKVG